MLEPNVGFVKTEQTRPDPVIGDLARVGTQRADKKLFGQNRLDRSVSARGAVAEWSSEEEGTIRFVTSLGCRVLRDHHRSNALPHLTNWVPART
jgi:hypothetical protein